MRNSSLGSVHSPAQERERPGVAPGSEVSDGAGGEDAGRRDVDLVDYRFVPDRLVFRRGVAYRLHLRNKGGEQHEFTAPEFLKQSEIENPEVVGTATNLSRLVSRPRNSQANFWDKRATNFLKVV